MRAAAVILGVAAAILLLLVPYYGRFLVVEDPLERADVIYVLGGSRADRPLEAADLYLQGYASKILLSDALREGAETTLRQRGIHVPGEAERARDLLIRVGVPPDAIIVSDSTHNSTTDEAASAREFAARQGWRSIIVVTSRLHTRRAGMVMRGALSGGGIRAIMRGTRHETTDPAHWWRHRNDVRLTLSELQKLIVYALRLG